MKNQPTTKGVTTMTQSEERAIAESNASLTARHEKEINSIPLNKTVAARVLSVLNAAGWKVSPINSCLVDCPENKDVWSSVQPLHCNDCINGDCVYNLAPRD